MKVHKAPSNPKQMSMRQHYKDKWFKPNKIPNSDSSNLSPSTAMVKLEHQASNLRKDQDNLKRLKEAKAMCFRQVKALADTGWTPTHPLTNRGVGGSEQGIDSDKSQDWSSFAKSVLHQNGDGERMDGQESSVSAKAAPGWIEEAAFVHCRARPRPKSHSAGDATGGKCLLSCMYGRVEVDGFTIEEGQHPYPLFTPSSHFPLTLTALGDSPNPSKTKKAGHLVAKAIVRKYLSETRKRLFSEVDSDSSVILLEPLDTPLTRFLTCFPDLNELFGLSSRDIRDSSAMLDTPLSGVGMTPLRKAAGGMVMSQTYREALSSLVNAGGGVLRGVDMARGLYFLVTPVAPSVLRQVNCLLLGAVTLPNILLTGQTGIVGETPYVKTDYSFELTGAGKIHVFKGLARPGQMNKAK